MGGVIDAIRTIAARSRQVSIGDVKGLSILTIRPKSPIGEWQSLETIDNQHDATAQLWSYSKNVLYISGPFRDTTTRLDCQILQYGSRMGSILTCDQNQQGIARALLHSSHLLCRLLVFNPWGYGLSISQLHPRSSSSVL